MVHRGSVDSLFDVPQELLDSIKRELKEEEERLKHVEDLVEAWIRSEKHLPDNYDKRMARNFIRGSKYNLDTTKRKLEGYFLAKYAFPHFYFNRDPNSKDIAKAFDCVNVVRLPKFTAKGERILYISINNPDPEEFDLEAAIKLFYMLYDLTLTSDYATYAEVVIFDCANVTSAHLIKLLSSTFKRGFTIMRDAYAARVSHIHVINCPNMVEKVITSVRPVVPEKLRKRYTVHRSSETLLKQLPTRVLPADVGGDLHSLRGYMERWRRLAVDNSDWFRQQEQVKIVGAPPKRIEKFTSDVSLEGSFRQLNID